VHPGKISLTRLVELFTVGPARIIRQPLGTLQPGKEADVTLFNPDCQWTYDVGETRSRSRNTPFHGTPLRGRAAAAIVRGQVAYRNPALL
jgi:dihydroorotase